MEVTKTLARVNQVNILLVENGDTWVPVKPICEALGIAEEPQIKKIKEDEILSSTTTLRVAVGADKKAREMVCIPFRYVFGWLFSINPKNVAPEAKETVLRYRRECYDVLYNHFTAHSRFYREKQEKLNDKDKELERIRAEFNTAKDRLEQSKKEFKELMQLGFDEWQAANNQMKIDFEENAEEKPIFQTKS